MRLHQKTALQKVSVLVKAGMMEPPKWYAAAKQVRRVVCCAPVCVLFVARRV